MTMTIGEMKMPTHIIRIAMALNRIESMGKSSVVQLEVDPFSLTTDHLVTVVVMGAVNMPVTRAVDENVAIFTRKLARAMNQGMELQRM